MSDVAVLTTFAPGSPPAFVSSPAPVAAEHAAGPARRIAVRTARAYWIIPIDSIVRISADDNYVVVRADRSTATNARSTPSSRGSIRRASCACIGRTRST